MRRELAALLEELSRRAAVQRRSDAAAAEAVRAARDSADAKAGYHTSLSCADSSEHHFRAFPTLISWNKGRAGAGGRGARAGNCGAAAGAR